MRIPDDVLIDYFKLTTDMNLEEVKKIIEKDVVEAHRVYAREIIKMYHGEKFIKQAEERYKKVAKGGIPDNIEEIKIEKSIIDNGISLPDLLLLSKLVPSKSEGRRMIQQNGISINGNKENNLERVITINDFDENSLIIQKGKKQFKKVVIK